MKKEETEEKFLKLLEKRGTTKVCATLLNVPQNTIQNWKKNKSIPAWRIDAIRKILKTLGKAKDE